MTLLSAKLRSKATTTRTFTGVSLKTMGNLFDKPHEALTGQVDRPEDRQDRQERSNSPWTALLG